MRLRAVLGITVLIILLLWAIRPHWGSMNPKTIQPKQKTTLQPKSAIKLIPLAHFKTSKQQTENLKMNTSVSKSDNLVKFEMKNGYAVAFGDLLLGKPETKETIKNGYTEPQDIHLWESREIPYLLEPDVPNRPEIIRAIEYFNTETSLKFVPWTDQRDAVVFQKGLEHCLSYLGKTGGFQPIFISQDCHLTEILHESMHALGFIHEHSRTDRDQALNVEWENIEEKYTSQFNVAPESWMLPLQGSSFDYSSIMLYEPTAFSKDPEKPTLKSKTQNMIHPVRSRLSSSDLERLENLYGRSRL